MVRRGSSHRPSQGSQRASIDVDNLPPSQSQGTEGFSGLAEAQQDEIVKRLIRYLLARNLRRRPTKRADLTRHVFHGMGSVRSKQKVFNGALSKARNKLKAVYAMDVEELVKVRRAQTGGARGSTTGFTMGSATQGGSGSTAGTKITAYVLVSTLREELRVKEPDRLAEWGLLTIIACMVVLNPGCSIRQDDLYRALLRVGVDAETDDKKRNSKQKMTASVRELVERDFPDQWYLSRDKVDGEMCYSLGPRLYKEMNDDMLVDLVEAVYSLGRDKEEGMDESARDEIHARLKEARGEVEEENDEEGETIELDDDDE